MEAPPRRLMKLTFGPVGHCIYCGSKDDLTLEHILPFSLGGNMELPAASCKACANITHRYEHTCARQIFGKLRIRHNLPTRRKKERPTKLTALVVTGPGDQTNPIELPASIYPTELFLYRFGPANVLLGAPAHLNTLEWTVAAIADDEELKAFAKTHGGNFATQARFYPVEFGRLLAKIAHAYAIANLGPNSFRPLALDVILGRSDNISHIVGGGNRDLPAVKDAGHLTALGCAQANGKVYLVAEIRLFASLPTPSYHVIVGEAESLQGLTAALERAANVKPTEEPFPY